MDSWDVSPELSGEAVARCCGELAAVIERYLPDMRPDDPDAAAFTLAAARFRRRGARDRQLLPDP
jgi:hypothetical protein